MARVVNGETESDGTPIFNNWVRDDKTQNLEDRIEKLEEEIETLQELIRQLEQKISMSSNSVVDARLKSLENKHTIWGGQKF